MEDIERTLLVKPEVFMYKIPPRQSASGYRAADWNLADPYWTGRMRCVVKGSKCTLRLEDKSSGELFAECPVEHHPSMSVESVTDSSRYFVICIQDSGRKAYIGIGFADRSDSFDLNVALQDHFKMIKKEDSFAKEAPQPNLDLAFKDGQTIRINIPKKDGTSSRTVRSGSLHSLPPPPGGISKIPGPSNRANSVQIDSVIGGDLLGDLSTTTTTTATATTTSNDDWGDFTAPATTTQTSGNWEQF